jgi:hypothetical protein
MLRRNSAHGQTSSLQRDKIEIYKYNYISGYGQCHFSRRQVCMGVPVGSRIDHDFPGLFCPWLPPILSSTDCKLRSEERKQTHLPKKTLFLHWKPRCRCTPLIEVAPAHLHKQQTRLILRRRTRALQGAAGSTAMHPSADTLQRNLPYFLQSEGECIPVEPSEMISTIS